MATYGSSAARPRELPHQVSIQTFVKNNPGHKALRKQAEALLTNENLVVELLKSPEGDQQNFMKKVDEVC